MNERIKQLAEQAVSAVDIVTGNEALDDELAKMYIPDCFAEKFAELIVGECCQKLEDDGMVEVAIEMKQHFGLEGMSTEDKKTLIKELLGVKND